MVNDDIDAIIVRGEERTLELNSKYEGLSFEDLSNFKSEASVQQWEGEDFRGNRKTLQFNPLALSKRERKLNYSVDSYFKETMRAGPSKTEKPPKIPRAPKQIQMQDFQFFPPRLAELQEQEMAAHKRMNDIPAVTRDAVSEDDTPEKLEEERKGAQEFIDSGVCSTSSARSIGLTGTQPSHSQRSSYEKKRSSPRKVSSSGADATSSSSCARSRPTAGK